MLYCIYSRLNKNSPSRTRNAPPTPRSTIGNGCGHRRRSVNLPPCLVLIWYTLPLSKRDNGKKKKEKVKEKEKKEKKRLKGKRTLLSLVESDPFPFYPLWVSLTSLVNASDPKVPDRRGKRGGKRDILYVVISYCLFFLFPSPYYRVLTQKTGA